MNIELTSSRLGQLQEHSRAGDAAAQTELGIFYLDRMICIEDYIALDLFKQAAAKGNTEAKFRLAMMFSNGRGTSPSQSTALYWYRQAASENHPDASFALQCRTGGNPSLTEKIHILDLAETGISLKQIKAVAKGIKKTAVSALHLKGNKLQDDAVKILSIHLKESQVRTLDLWKNHVSSTGLKYLADSWHEMKLEILDLAENQIDDEGAIYCAGKIAQSALHTLHLGDNKIGSEGAQALAKTLPLTKIKVLDIGRNKIEACGMNALLVQSHLQILDLSENTKSPINTLEIDLDRSSVEYLDLKQNLLNDNHLLEVAKTLPKSKVRALNLRDNRIGPQGVVKLSEAMPPSMNLLNLRGNPIGDEGAIALSDAIKRIPLETLNIGGCSLGVKGFQGIIDALPESQIHTLNLGGNRIGCVALQFTFSKKLKFLDLAGNSLGIDNGVRIGLALKNSVVEHCDFSGNNFGYNGVKAIFENVPKTMKVMNLSSNDIGPEGWDIFATRLLLTHINHLILTNNKMGNRGVTLLSSSIRKVPLENLSLENNGIGKEGMEVFAKYLPRKLQVLNLSSNPIGDEGLKFLLDHIHKTKIHTLILSNCNLTNKSAQLLLEHPLQNVILKDNAISVTMLNRLSQTIEKKNIPLISRDLSLVVDARVSPEDLDRIARKLMGDEFVFIDHFEILEEIPYGKLLEVAKKRLGIQENQKNLVLRIFFKSHGKPLQKEELKTFCETLYNGLNHTQTRQISWT